MGLFRYVALGDSSAVGVGATSGGGYPERLFQSMRALGPVGFLNLGESGAVSAELLEGAVAKAVSKRPHLVTLGIGTNDAWRLVPEASFAANLSRIADSLQATGARVLVCNLIDLALAPAAAMAERWTGISAPAFTARALELNRHLEALATRPGFELVDLFAFSRRELPGHPEYFCPDGVHPSALGYQRWAELILPKAREVLQRWTAAPD